MSERYEWTDTDGVKWIAEIATGGPDLFYLSSGGHRTYSGGANGEAVAVRELLRLAPLAPLLDPDGPSEEDLAALPRPAQNWVVGKGLHDAIMELAQDAPSPHSSVVRIIRAANEALRGRISALEAQLAEAQAENGRIHTAAAALLSRLAEGGAIQLGDDLANALAVAVHGEDHETTKELRRWEAV